MDSRNWRVFGVWIAVAMSLTMVPQAVCRAGLPTAEWLPADLKLHFSIANYPVSKPLFDKTGLGQLLRDDAVRPFLQGVPDQLRSRAQGSWLGLMWVDLGVDWDRFASVPSGEVAWAVFDVKGTPAAALIADVTGKESEVERFCGEIAAAMAKQNITPKQQEIEGATLTYFELPKRGKVKPTTLAYFVHDGFFVATRDIGLARRMVPRVGVRQHDNLSGLASYQHVLSECRKAAKDAPHATLYLVPFDCIELMDRVATVRNIEIERSPEIYRTQGFDAFSAVGATIQFAGPGGDFSFFASLYAPKPWSQSMQMVDLRNGPVALESWVSQEVAACSRLNLNAKSIYANLGPFFDEVVADGAAGTWDDILVALRDDKDGPLLDLEREVLAYLSGPAVVIESERLPVTPDSPQVLLAIKSSNEPALRAGIAKAMQDDPLIRKRKIGDVTCHYSVSPDNDEQVLWIIGVARGHLFMANDFDILTPIVQQKTGQPLAVNAAFLRAKADWKKDLADDASTFAFYRLDRWVEVRYELLRTGKRVAPHKTFGGMINGFFGGEPSEDEEPQLDGTKLPPFDQIRKYFGVFDAAIVTVKDGWLLRGHMRR